MLHLENPEAFLELSLESQEPEGLPSAGDARMTVRVSSAGFAGHKRAWVAADDLRGFCISLIALEHERQGKAELISISPNELVLTIRSIDRRGHMKVEGTTGHHVYNMRDRPASWHAVHAAASVAWVKANAAAARR